MNDAELTKVFPFGAMVIKKGDNPFSAKATLKDDYDEEPDLVNLWFSAYHGVSVSRDFKAENDGYATEGYGGTKYFLRPLTEEDKF